MNLHSNGKRLSSSECASVFTALLFLVIVLLYFDQLTLALSPFALNDFFRFDFQLRYNEVQCLLSGVNPFKVWRGDVSLPPFTPWHWGFENSVWHDYVHAYPPWSYSFFLPLGVLPKHLSVMCFLLVEALCVIGLYGSAYFYDKNVFKPFWARMLPVIAAMPILPSVCECLTLLNYGLIIAVSVFVMAICLDRNRQIAAGACLALAMIKPQIGMLFVVPLLMGRQYKTVICGGAICVLASIPPALMCGESPIDMVLSIKEYSAAYSQSDLPQGAFFSGQLSALAGHFGNVVVNALIGIVACVGFSYQFRNERNWLMRILPAMVLCVMWTVSRRHDHCVYIIALFVLAKMVVDEFKRLDVVAACFLPYFCFVFLRGAGVNYLLSSATFIFLGIVATCVAMCIIWHRQLIRNVLFVTMPMAILSTCIKCLDMNVCSMIFLMTVAALSKSCNIHMVLLLSLTPVLFFLSGVAFPSQTTGWLVLALLFLLGRRLNENSYMEANE